VRGTKNPDLAAIRRLEPDLVVANAEENRKLDVQRLEAGLTAVFVTMPTTVSGAVAELRDLATAVGDLPGAAALDAELVAAVADAYRRRPGRRVRYAWATTSNRPSLDWPLTCRNAPAQVLGWPNVCSTTRPGAGITVCARNREKGEGPPGRSRVTLWL